MARKLKVAAIQMDVAPAPTAERLARAERLVSQAAEAGAQLVVLPEVFNTGYAYTPDNYQRAEPLDGPTATWMKEAAARLGLHLAGSLMLLDYDEVYNALLLFAPDGRLWRYDKNYPWGWERGYFRDSNRIVVAKTDLGDLGLMVCADSAHAELWRRYAGRVDMMIICSCPPDISNPTYYFPNGERLTLDDLGMSSMKDVAIHLFGESLNQQAAWMGVPVVNTVACGTFDSAIPNGLGTMLVFLPAVPHLVKYLPQANGLRMRCAMVPGCKVVDANGQVLTQLAPAQGEAFALAEVVLADEKPQPASPQPAIPFGGVGYFASDIAWPQLTAPLYRRGLRRAWGPAMAPVDSIARHWLPLLGLGALGGLGLGLLAGLLLGRRR